MTTVAFIETALGMGITGIITLVLTIGTLPIYAKDVKTGLLSTFIVAIVEFIWFYLAGMDYKLVLKLIFIIFGLLSLMLIFVRKQGESAGSVF